MLTLTAVVADHSKARHAEGTAVVVQNVGEAPIHAEALDSELYDLTQEDAVSYAVLYGEFLYKAGSWDYPRRIVCKVEKPCGQMLHKHTFVVTNMDSLPEDLIRFYCKRGQMENFIKECKSGFDMSYVSSSSMNRVFSVFEIGTPEQFLIKEGKALVSKNMNTAKTILEKAGIQSPALQNILDRMRIVSQKVRDVNDRQCQPGPDSRAGVQSLQLVPAVGFA